LVWRVGRNNPIEDLAVTPEDIVRTYEELAKILEAHGLAWIVEQVEQTVRAGRPVEKQTHIFREEDLEEEVNTRSVDEQDGARRAGKPTLMMTLEPWGTADQLRFLIDGVRQAIVYAAALENEQLRLLKGTGVREVLFVSDEVRSRVRLQLTGVRDDVIQLLAGLLDALDVEALS
jgi:hypothetical protein